MSSYRRLLDNRPLLRLLLVEFVSSIGNWIALLAVLVAVASATESPLLLAAVGGGRILPYVLLSVPAGIVVDRFERRALLIALDVTRGALAVVLTVLAADHAPAAAIVLVVLVVSGFNVFFGPAIGAYLPGLTSTEIELATAVTANRTLEDIAFAIGPLLGGLVIEVGGLAGAFAFNALTFGAVLLVLVRLPASRAGGDTAAAVPGSTRARIAVLRGPLGLDIASSFVGGGMGVLTVIVAADLASADHAALSVLNAAIGAGGLVSAALAGVALAFSLRLTMVVAVAAATVVLALTAAAGSFAIVAVLLVFLTGSLLIVDAANAVVIQRIVDDAWRGRALGTMQFVGASFAVAGGFVLPLIGGQFGVRGAFVVALAVTLVAAGGGLASLLVRGDLAARGPDPERVAVLESALPAGLPLNRLERAAGQLVRRDIAAGEVVVRQGEVGGDVYFVESGTFVVEQARGPEGAAVDVLRHLEAPAMFGELAPLRHSSRSATVRAETDARVWVLPESAFLDLVAPVPSVAARMIGRYES